MRIQIDGELYHVANVMTRGDMPQIETEEGPWFFLAESSEAAGEAARKHWEDMAKNDQREFICLVGEENLLRWALGEYAGPGSTQVKSLDEWLDIHRDNPEETFASYDDIERQVNRVGKLADELEFVPTVAYRSN